MGISWEEIKEQKRPSRSEVPLSLDPALAQAHAEAKQAVDEARQALEFRPDSVERQRRLDEAEEALEEARAALEPRLVYFTLESLGRESFEELIDAHPATKDQRDRWRKENPQHAAAGVGIRWNTDTFAPALLAACIVEPKTSVKQATELWNGGMGFNQGEVNLLFGACLEVNQNARVVHLGKGSRRTDPSESNSPSVLTTA